MEVKSIACHLTPMRWWIRFTGPWSPNARAATMRDSTRRRASFRRGKTYLAQEYAPYGSLHRWIRTQASLEASTVAEIARQVARGLHLQHAYGLKRRPVMSKNVLVFQTSPVLVKVTRVAASW